jgi:phosphatidylinositol 3-kinase
MEFVPNSSSIQDALMDSKYDMQTYLNNLSTDPEESQKIFNNYLLSTAGYGCATYLLAIGDRHLENLMVRDNGKMWHLDFGYILGKHPPKKGYFVPAIRIN